MDRSGSKAPSCIRGPPRLGTGPWLATVDRLAEVEEALWLPGLLVTNEELEAARPRARISWAATLERYLWRDGEAGASSWGFPATSPGTVCVPFSMARLTRGSGAGEGGLLVAPAGRELGGVSRRLGIGT